MSLLLSGAGGVSGGGSSGGGSGGPSASESGGVVTITGANDGNFWSVRMLSGKARIVRTGGIDAGSGFSQINDNTVEYDGGDFSGKAVVFEGGDGTDQLDHRIYLGESDPFDNCVSLTLNCKGGVFDQWSLEQEFDFIGWINIVTKVDEDGIYSRPNYDVHYNLD